MKAIGSSEAVEDPERLRRFAQEVSGLDWSGAAPEALERLFSALTTLVHHEVEFYYRARKRQRRFSAVTRGSAIFLSTLGIIAPLLANVDSAVPREIGAYGYPLFALAGSMLVVNRLFGATGGHVRYVTAQLELERILTTARLDWAAWNARSAIAAWDEARISGGFAILRVFSHRAYQVIQSETVAWGKDVSDALTEYSRSMQTQPSSSSGTRPTQLQQES